MPTGLQEPEKWRFLDFLSNRLVVKFLPPKPGFEKWASELLYRVCSNEQFIDLATFEKKSG